MEGMFGSAHSFNQPLGDWDVSRVTDMSFMFSDAISFDQSLGNWNVSKAMTLQGMFDGVKLSTPNYDNILEGWAQLQLKSGVYFSGGNSRYSDDGETARQYIIDNFQWVITDGGHATAIPGYYIIALFAFMGISIAVQIKKKTLN